jgi:hypothetical protein
MGHETLTLWRKVVASLSYCSGLIVIVMTSFAYRSGLIGIVLASYSYRSSLTGIVTGPCNYRSESMIKAITYNALLFTSNVAHLCI